jgi:hypothetical protein
MPLAGEAVKLRRLPSPRCGELAFALPPSKYGLLGPIDVEPNDQPAL